ncbi:hypothetical protein D9C73_009599 [Collichthys lucidus]|uniref:Uncharacterized protein n=1 Tax=Collichthys lucidus TaxID=240159 RepID=A0A4U5UN94_COLLU|nr:hypothetical protein D9C73_009599 [Collichthys lucidus]
MNTCALRRNNVCGHCIRAELAGSDGADAKLTHLRWGQAPGAVFMWRAGQDDVRSRIYEQLCGKVMGTCLHHFGRCADVTEWKKKKPSSCLHVDVIREVFAYSKIYKKNNKISRFIRLQASFRNKNPCRAIQSGNSPSLPRSKPLNMVDISDSPSESCQLAFFSLVPSSSCFLGSGPVAVTRRQLHSQQLNLSDRSEEKSPTSEFSTLLR